MIFGIFFQPLTPCRRFLAIGFHPWDLGQAPSQLAQTGTTWAIPSAEMAAGGASRRQAPSQAPELSGWFAQKIHGILGILKWDTTSSHLNHHENRAYHNPASAFSRRLKRAIAEDSVRASFVSKYRSLPWVAPKPVQFRSQPHAAI